MVEKTFLTPDNISEELIPANTLCYEYWEAIAECKRRFVTNGQDPLSNPYLRREVAESWIRSKGYGVYPWTPHKNYCISNEELQLLREQNRKLIQVAEPLINNFLELASASGHSLELFDPSGAFLSGVHIRLSDAPLLAVVWNESTTGTTAHGLATYYKKPFQLIGPENYLDVLKNTVCTAAPILDDETGEVLGALALVEDLGERPWDKSLKKLHAHSLGWVSSLAMAIEKQLKVQNSYDTLNEVNIALRKATEALKIILEFIDEGIITIEPDGTIIRSNQEAGRMLNVSPDQVKGLNIKDFLSDKSMLMNVVNQKKSVDFMEEYLKIDQEERPYVIGVKPVFKKNSSSLDFAILRLQYSEKIDALVTSRSGAVAKVTFKDIIGESESINKTKSLAARFAKSRENILLLGESGTGKELFAQAIHNSYCPNGPFIAVNCAAIPRNLIESELFGYESGAFTGAEKNGRPGKIELANGGTLFLDEIGDMPYELQAALLRVLQDKMVMRIGGKNYRKVNFRLITATNQNLPQLIQEKKFREDLYFRLSVLTIEIPPLRNRGFDIAILAEHFIKNYAERMGIPVPSISPEAKQKMLEYNWPGNVRQLENAIIYAVNLAEQGVIRAEHLPLGMLDRTKIEEPKNHSPDTQGEALADEPLSIKEAEKAVIQKALARAGNRVAIASKLLGISKTTLYRKLKEHDIQY